MSLALECSLKRIKSVSEHQKAYEKMVTGIVDLYGVKPYKEHECVREFYEGDIPLFKLIYSPGDEEQEPMIVVSFHLDVDSVYAIQWYTRLQDLCPPLRITHCYYQDDAGQTFVGEYAEIVKMYKTEQAAIANWIRENEETDEENLEKKVIVEPSNSLKKVYTSKEQAVQDFNRMKKGKKDEYH